MLYKFYHYYLNLGSPIKACISCEHFSFVGLSSLSSLVLYGVMKLYIWVMETVLITSIQLPKDGIIS